MDKPTKSVTLTEGERSALQAICRRRKVDALVWKRARAFLLLDAGEDAQTVCRILDIGPTVLEDVVRLGHRQIDAGFEGRSAALAGGSGGRGAGSVWSRRAGRRHRRARPATTMGELRVRPPVAEGESGSAIC